MFVCLFFWSLIMQQRFLSCHIFMEQLAVKCQKQRLFKLLLQQYIPEYQVNPKECKHDNAVANYPSGITDLVEEEEPFIHQSTESKVKIFTIMLDFGLILPCIRAELWWSQERQEVYLGVVHTRGLRVAR